MGRIYGETIENKIRNGILIAAFLICLFSCKKGETEICKTCTVSVMTDMGEPGSPPLTTIESQTEYCNHEYDTIKQGIIENRKWSTNGGQTWNIQTKTRECE